jgi:glycosyltransferase involved in cell wall biosynthesis
VSAPLLSIDTPTDQPGSLGLLARAYARSLDRLAIPCLRNAPDAPVHVRLRWPPDWSPPAHGAWVLFQPWEFGAIPRDWVPAIQTMIDEVWTLSADSARAFIRSGVPSSRVRVVPGGVDPRRFHPEAPPWHLATDKPIRFLRVGGTTVRKGIREALEAYRQAFGPDDPVAFVIKDQGVGTYYHDSLAAEVRALAEAREGPEIVYLDAETSYDALPGLYTACTCLLQPYLAEGYCLPAAEAMACGRPVIVTQGGPTDEFVPEDAGWRVPASPQRIDRVGADHLAAPGHLLQPDVAALARLLREIVHHPEEFHRRGQAAREAALDCAWERAAREIASHARRLAGQPPRREAVGLLGAARGVTNYVAVPNWPDQRSVRRGVHAFAERARRGPRSTLYLVHPSEFAQRACWMLVESALRSTPGGAALRERIQLATSGSLDAVRPVLLSAADVLLPCGGNAERSWLADARALGRLAGTPARSEAGAA